jgi:hypothetical protein
MRNYKIENRKEKEKKEKQSDHTTPGSYPSPQPARKPT